MTVFYECPDPPGDWFTGAPEEPDPPASTGSPWELPTSVSPGSGAGSVLDPVPLDTGGPDVPVPVPTGVGLTLVLGSSGTIPADPPPQPVSMSASAPAIRMYLNLLPSFLSLNQNNPCLWTCTMQILQSQVVHLFQCQPR